MTLKEEINNTIKLMLAKRLSFTDAVSIIIAVVGYFSLLSFGVESEAKTIGTLIYKLIGFPAIFIIRSTLSKSYKQIGRVFNDSWDIIREPGITDLEKQLLLRSYLELKMETWIKYWIQFKTIVCNDKSWQNKWNQIKKLFTEIYKGEMNAYQGTWLGLYYIYSILSLTGLLEILAPYDIIVCLIFMGVLYYATGDLVGLGSILIHVFNLLTVNQSEEDIKRALIETEKELKTGAHVYYFYTADKPQVMV